ncbi:hypothetical protein [Demequina sp.]|uniref:hypothetical protein n=1 Tax=Demequina sp. TaxID=2050685 RepID=UPI003A891143
MAVLLAAFYAGLVDADAARLTVVAAPHVEKYELSACAESVLEGEPVMSASASGSGTVTLAGVPTACEGTTLDLFLHSGDGSVLAAGSIGAVASGSATVDVGGFDQALATTAVARLGGWIFPVSWQGDAERHYCVGVDASGVPTGDDCSLTISGVNSWTSSDGSTTAEVYFRATTSAPSWRVHLDLGDTEVFPAIEPVGVGSYNSVAIAPGFSCANLPQLVVMPANPSWGEKSGSFSYTDAAGKSLGTMLCE